MVPPPKKSPHQVAVPCTRRVLELPGTGCVTQREGSQHPWVQSWRAIRVAGVAGSRFCPPAPRPCSSPKADPAFLMHARSNGLLSPPPRCWEGAKLIPMEIYLNEFPARTLKLFPARLFPGQSSRGGGTRMGSPTPRAPQFPHCSRLPPKPPRLHLTGLLSPQH